MSTVANPSSKITLGTANLGMAYGITNNKSYNPTTSIEIIKAAVDNGINKFDTAPDYGNAETILGSILSFEKDLDVTTKIPKLPEYSYDIIYDACLASMKKMNIDKITNLLFHDAEIHDYRSLDYESSKLLNSGLVENIGFSAYSANDVYLAKTLNPSWTVFQLPGNIADRRILESQQIIDFVDEGNKINLRSIFLQGLLLANPANIPAIFPEITELVKSLVKIAEYEKVSVLDLCLSYLETLPWINSYVVGVADVNQLKEILDYTFVGYDFNSLPYLDSELLDPRNWSNTT
jgi:aryl-alcohol dehydrogenase-like predicted oxidoreductase